MRTGCPANFRDGGGFLDHADSVRRFFINYCIFKFSLFHKMTDVHHYLLGCIVIRTHDGPKTYIYP